MGVDAAQSAQPPTTGAQSSPIGQLDGSGIPDHDVLNVAASVGENTDLAADLVADLAQLPGEFVAHQPVGGQAALEEALELAYLAGLEASGVAKDLDGGLRIGEWGVTPGLGAATGRARA